MNRKTFFLKYKISTKQFAHIRLSSGQLSFRAEFTQVWPFFSANNASVFTSCLDETGYTHATKIKLDRTLHGHRTSKKVKREAFFLNF